MDMDNWTFSANILQGYWPLFAAVVGIVFYILSNISDHSKRIKTLENDKTNQTTLLVQIQKDIVELKTTLTIFLDSKNK